MNRYALALIVAAGVMIIGQKREPTPVLPPPANPVPSPQPVPVPAPTPKPKPKPWGDHPASVEASVGGPVSPTGEPIHCDLPGPLHRKNTASKGLGLCVFTSIHHSATWQNVPQLVEFPAWIIQKGIPGGSYPEKTAKMIKQICQDRGMPEPDYIQVENADLDILRKACASGRMPAITYWKSPTGRYGGSRISHMVSLPHAGAHFAVLDNNYPGADKYEWLDDKEFLKAYTGGTGKGWSVILLAPPPPMPPKNKPIK